MPNTRKLIEWYKEKSITAAEHFVADANERIKNICSDPLRYRNTYKHFREVSLKTYPYYILYFIYDKANRTLISSVYHHKRNPGK